MILAIFNFIVVLYLFFLVFFYSKELHSIVTWFKNATIKSTQFKVLWYFNWIYSLPSALVQFNLIWFVFDFVLFCLREFEYIFFNLLFTVYESVCFASIGRWGLTFDDDDDDLVHLAVALLYLFSRLGS